MKNISSIYRKNFIKVKEKCIIMKFISEYTFDFGIYAH